MDPQACLARIFDMIRDGDDKDDIYYAFKDLAEWLVKGGFPPILASLEEVMPLNDKIGDRKRVNVHGRPHYTIQIVDHLNQSGDGPYEFVVWDHRGEPKHRFALPMKEIDRHII